MTARTRTIFHIGALAGLLGISALAMATSAEAYSGHDRGIEDSGGHDASHGGGGMYGGGSSGGGWGGMSGAHSSHGGGWGMASGGSSGTGGWSGTSGHGHSGGDGDDHHHHHHPIAPFLPGQFSGQGGSGYSNDEDSYGYSGACPYPYQPAHLTYGRTVCVTP